MRLKKFSVLTPDGKTREILAGTPESAARKIQKPYYSTHWAIVPAPEDTGYSYFVVTDERGVSSFVQIVDHG